MMAQIRALIADLQFVDQGMTPTYVSATQFSVAGDQTSAIHAGRRLKLFDATTVYATVVTASFTAVTNIHVTADAATLTSSLSSFAIAILSVTNPSIIVNPGTLSSLLVLSTLSVSGATALNGALSVGGAVALGTTLSVSGAAVVKGALSVGGATTLGTTLSVSGATALNGALTVGGATTLGTTLSVSGAAVLKGALSVGGATNLGGTLSVSGTAVASNIAKAWARGTVSIGGASIVSSFNVASISRSDTGCVRITFTNAMIDASYCPIFSAFRVNGNAVDPSSVSILAASVKFTIIDGASRIAIDDTNFAVTVYR
jgi:hypothetical protein